MNNHRKDGGEVLRGPTVPAAMVTALLVLAACAPGAPAGGAGAAGPGSVRVVATVYPVYAFAEAVGGERIEASLLLPPGVEGHDFEPTPGAVRDVARADLILANGAGFEPWLERLLAAAPDAGDGGARRVEASDGIALLRLPAAGGAPGPSPEAADLRTDPHVWLDPLRAAKQAANIRDALIAADAGGSAGYRQGSRRLQERLRVLHEDFAAALGRCAHRELVVEHAAFGYVAARYGLQQVAAGGPARELQPTPRRMAELAALLRRRGVQAVFYGPLTDARAVRALAREVGAETLLLHPLANLTREEWNRGETYTSLMRANLANLRRGLDCAREGDAP